jgi:hypothetical protein
MIKLYGLIEKLGSKKLMDDTITALFPVMTAQNVCTKWS